VTQRHLIVKADDYARIGSCLDLWRRFASVMCDNGCVASVGVVGEALGTDKIPASLAPFLRSIAEEYRWEVWNHSHRHRDVRGLSADEIAADILASQSAIEQAFGVRPAIFGPPFNLVDARSAREIAATEPFQGYYFVDDVADRTVTIARQHLVSAESGTSSMQPVRFQRFLSEIARLEYPEFIILQVHPYFWSSDCFGSFDRILRHLLDAGYQGIRGIDRVELQRVAARLQPPTYGAAMGPSLAAQDAIVAGAAADEGFVRPDSAYYLRVIREGWSEIAQFLNQLGFGRIPPARGGGIRFADIGTGSAVWAAALSTLHTESLTYAIDREDRHLAPVARLFPPDRIVARIGEFDDVAIDAGSLTGVVCNNALSYMPLARTFDRIARLLQSGGKCFVGIQNRLYPLLDVLAAARAGRSADALAFLCRLVGSDGYLAGRVARPFVVYLNHEEMTAMAALGGLKMQRATLRTPGFERSLGGAPTFCGYLSAKTDAMRRHRDEVLAGRATDPALDWYARLEGLLPDPSGVVATPPRSARIAEAFHAAATHALTDIEPGPSPEPSELLDPLHLALLGLIGALRRDDCAEVDARASSVEVAASRLSDAQRAHWL
jgi:peptidoglycan/xylan/chitin deacetylase (PgdA/CDA1 family)